MEEEWSLAVEAPVEVLLSVQGLVQGQVPAA